MPGDFYGIPTYTLGNNHLCLDVLIGAGPRIVRLLLADSGHNLLAEVPAVKWPTPFGEYFLRGGHRLWHAPEVFPRTCVPDNDGLVIEEMDEGILLRQPTEQETGIQKSICIRLHPDRPALTLTHSLQNNGLWPVELAPWAITQLPPGGIAILPQQVGSQDRSGLLPDRLLVLWPYTGWGDPRLHPGDDFILVEATPRLPPMKIGTFNPHGWIAYVRNGVLFCKRFDVLTGCTFPDFGCNTEVYCNDMFIELETLGPLARLEPGQVVTHQERWELYTGLPASPTIETVRDAIAPLGL